MSERTIDLGTDGHGNRALVTITITPERVSITGEIRCYGHGYSWGQCDTTIRALYPRSPKVLRFCDMWDRWHLNDMRAGCSHQEARFRDYPNERPTYRNDYRGKSGVTLSPDYMSKCLMCGYAYGSAWNREDVPADVVEYFATFE